MYQSKGIDITHMNKKAVTFYLPDKINCEHEKLKISIDVHISPTSTPATIYFFHVKSRWCKFFHFSLSQIREVKFYFLIVSIKQYFGLFNSLPSLISDDRPLNVLL